VEQPRGGPARLLAGRCALVMDAATGVQAGVARALAAAGARLALCDTRRADAAAGLARDIEAAGGEAFAVRADPGADEEAGALFAHLQDVFGGLDILVLGSGPAPDGPVLELPLADWRRELDVNLTGTFLLARAAARCFVRRGGGTLLLVSQAQGSGAGHGVARAGLAALMDVLARELAPHRVRVNTLAAGVLRAPADPARAAELLARIPSGRTGTPADVARAAVWLCSDEAAYVTGATLHVDGGLSLGRGE
jgi:glucose 1-dehydrogenase